MVTQLVVGFFQTNCYIYTQRDRCLVIDPGADAALIINSLQAIERVPDGILLTHGHLDHTMAAEELQNHYRRGRRRPDIAIHHQDAKYLGENGAAESRKLLHALGVGGMSAALPLPGELPEVDILIAEGDQLFGTDLGVLETPGHTGGGCSFYSLLDGIVFSGDTLFRGGIGRSDLPDGDPKRLLAVIRSKLFTLPPETIVYPGHGPQTTVETEMRDNPFIP